MCVGQLLACVGLDCSRNGINYSRVLVYINCALSNRADTTQVFLCVTRACWSELLARVGLNCSRNGINYSRVLVYINCVRSNRADTTQVFINLVENRSLTESRVN